MDHLSPSQVIAYVGGESTPTDRAACAAHLAMCSACATLVQTQQRLVGVLDAWGPADASETDVAAAVLARLDAPQTLRLRPWRWAAALRVAAAIVLGLGVGYFSGRWRVSVTPAQPVAVPTIPGATDTTVEPLDYALFADPDMTGLEFAYDELMQAEQGRAS